MGFFSFINQSHSVNSRQTNIAYADYFNVIISWKKRFTENWSFTNFCFAGSRSWFVIHESQTLSSYSHIPIPFHLSSYHTVFANSIFFELSYWFKLQQNRTMRSFVSHVCQCTYLISSWCFFFQGLNFTVGKKFVISMF